MSVSVRSLENLHPYPPGANGYKGRPRRLLERVLRVARLHSVEAVEHQVCLMRSSSTPPAVRLAATMAILDRAWGKPKEQIEIAGDSGVPMLTIKIVDPNSDIPEETITINAAPEPAGDAFVLPIGKRRLAR